MPDAGGSGGYSSPRRILTVRTDDYSPPSRGTYTDDELRDLAQLASPIRGTLVRETNGAGSLHKQRIFRAWDHPGRARAPFPRLSGPDDAPSFSCGIAYIPPGGPRLTLARYNGSNHRHGDIHYRPHIHRATEAAITAGRRPEDEAMETTRYETLEGALACLDDFGLSGIRAEPDHPSLFAINPDDLQRRLSGFSRVRVPRRRAIRSTCLKCLGAYACPTGAIR